MRLAENGTATVEDVGLLGEIGGVTALTVVAQETIRNGTGVRSTAGSHFAGLVILGALPINLPANTGIALSGKLLSLTTEIVASLAAQGSTPARLCYCRRRGPRTAVGQLDL